MNTLSETLMPLIQWGGGWGHGPGMMGWGAMSWVGGIMMLIFWIVVIIGLIVLIRWVAGRSKGEDSPLEILRKRYAKGEINKEEFESRKKDLE